MSKLVTRCIFITAVCFKSIRKCREKENNEVWLGFGCCSCFVTEWECLSSVRLMIYRLQNIPLTHFLLSKHIIYYSSGALFKHLTCLDSTISKTSNIFGGFNHIAGWIGVKRSDCVTRKQFHWCISHDISWPVHQF